MYDIGTRVYVEYEATRQGAHGYIVPTPRHYLSWERILMVRHDLAHPPHNTADCPIAMRDLHSGIHATRAITVRPDQWLCPPHQACAVCCGERTPPDAEPPLRQRPSVLHWIAEAHDIDDPYQPAFHRDSGQIFSEVYRGLSHVIDELDALLVTSWTHWGDGSCGYGYDVHADGRQIATACIKAVDSDDLVPQPRQNPDTALA